MTEASFSVCLLLALALALLMTKERQKQHLVENRATFLNFLLSNPSDPFKYVNPCPLSSGNKIVSICNDTVMVDETSFFKKERHKLNKKSSSKTNPDLNKNSGGSTDWAKNSSDRRICVPLFTPLFELRNC